MIPSYLLAVVRKCAVYLYLPLSIPLILAGCSGGYSGNGGQSGSPALAAVVATQGNFSSGQQNASYAIQVTNSGTAATTGTVTVIDRSEEHTSELQSHVNLVCR